MIDANPWVVGGLIYVLIGCVFASAFMASPQADELEANADARGYGGKYASAIAGLFIVAMCVFLWLPLAVVALVRSFRRP